MSNSIENQIYQRISRYKKGKIFFPSMFLELGSSVSIRQALKRLENKELLIRLAPGIYLYPKKSKLLGIVLYPSTEELAIAISKRDKARLVPTGSQALNKLGLSTQVPLNHVYLTDGSPRIVKIGNRSIKFKKASPKILAVKSKLNLLAIQALKAIGKNNIDEVSKNKIKQTLSSVAPNLIIHDMKLAPNWISEIMKEVLKNSKNNENEKLV